MRANERLNERLCDGGLRHGGRSWKRLVRRAGVGLGLTLGLLLPTVAAAQWAWVDASGQRVFSDRPPPPDVPRERILRAPAAPSPGAAGVAPAPAAGADAGLAPPAAASSAKPAAAVDEATRKLQEQKKQQEEAEKAKERAEQQRLAKIRADNCQRARQALVGLDSGMPMRVTNAKGEQVFMDEATRRAERQRLEGVIRSDCGR